MPKHVIRSPFFYVGDKYKLMPQLKELFPQKISTYVEPFAGGGSSFLNTNAERYLLNDVDFYVVELHKCLSSYSKKKGAFLRKLYGYIREYNLSCSYKNVTVPDELKKTYVKTYYSKYNKNSYDRMKVDFNRDKSNMVLLYLLLIYGFNHMIRFNGAGDFNLPVGNVDFNKNVYKAISSYMDFMKSKNVSFFNSDFQTFLNDVELDADSYVYFDPPYLISGSEYNKYWNESEEHRLCDFIDSINDRGIKFGITNLVNHKGKVNTTFLEWSKKYIAYSIKSNYISFNDNTIKAESKELFVTNYGTT
jgi:DNA adenine methylase